MARRLSDNAKLVLAERYLRRDAAGRTVETPDGLFRRVAQAIAAADARYEGSAAGAEFEEQAYHVLSNLEFLPNSPTLMNAGLPDGQLAACFVLPVDDDLGSIFGALGDMARIHQSGGGTGFDFSRLRPRGDAVRETGGVASGPVSFLRVFDVATGVIRQGGRRRGANMAVLAADHPDVFEFVRAKEPPGALSNFNLSLALPERFFAALEHDAAWPLVHPRDGRVTARPRALELWRAIAQAAWRSGDPGVLMSDAIEAANPTPALGRLEATNPCGEQPLLPFEACTLGSIHLGLLAAPERHDLDWERLDSLVDFAVRFLDDTIDASTHPLPAIADAVHATRKIGLGVMGFAEALIRLGVPYDAPAAVALAGRIMQRIESRARRASAALAERRGAFPAMARSVWPARGWPRLRNATVTTIAPTGTLSILAGTTSGIEPLFAVAWVRRALDGRELPEVAPRFEEALAAHGLPVEPTLDRAASTGSIAALDDLPADLRARFRTAHDVTPDAHLAIQAAFQRHTDNAVSKTVNLAASAGVDEVAGTFARAHALGLKGVTVFRQGCRGEAALRPGRAPQLAHGEHGARADAEYAGECRICSV